MQSERSERIREFVQWCQTHITGDEKGESHIFLDRLFKAFGQAGALDVGGQTEFRVRKTKEDGGGTAFADYVWKPVVLIEMKKRGENLNRHFRQAFDYWVRLAPNRPKYVMLCNFDEFWVYNFDSAQMDAPVDTVPLVDLPDRWGPLAFLYPTGERPSFGNDHEAVTREAADLLATCFKKLVARNVERGNAQRFILQMLVALFAEDIGLLEKYFVTQLIEECKAPADSYDLLGGLFEAMNTPGRAHGGRFRGVDYFNGGLFSEPARLELYDDELAQLRQAAKSDWSKVRPEIFGTLFEQSLGHDERHASGAHFTSPVDIMKIVGPTIVDPWHEAIEKAKSRSKLAGLLERLQHLTVLDPACGSGNFLYLAYREMKRLEARIIERMKEYPQKGRRASAPKQRQFGFVTARQFFGIDINPFAVELAKVTMMIARKLAIDELHVTEQALPLDNLDTNFIAADALIDPAGNDMQWPKADVIIGNPPFLDARKMTLEHGRKYVNSLSTCYPQIARRADYCTYWIRKTHDQLPPCTPDDPFTGRAGLVGTQNIRNNESREGGLDHVVHIGTIVEAVENQPWSGEANVHVSIVNWIKTQDPSIVPAKKRLWFKIDSAPQKRSHRRASKQYELDFRDCRHINASLSDQTDVTQAARLRCNFVPKVVFEGVQTGHDGFVIGKSEASALMRDDSHRPYIKPFINGSDLLSGRYIATPEYVVDMSELNMLEASAMPQLLAIPKERVLKDWQNNAQAEHVESGKKTGEHQDRLETWWALKRPRGDLQNALKRLTRYVACSAVMKRPVFVFLSSQYLPTNAIKVFAFEDDYSFGVLQSSAHWLWFVTKCSKLKADYRYTPDSVFDTFPWPQSPTVKQIDEVATAGRLVRAVRTEALSSIKGGLRAVYRTLELPGANPLKDAQAALDSTVRGCYGFSDSEDILAALLDLNSTMSSRMESSESVVAPGIPPNYPNPKRLTTDDCIQPP